MAVDLNRLMALEMPVGRQMPTAKDAILYAISVGYAGQSAVPEDLSPLYEPIVRPVPTFANVVAVPGGRALTSSGIDFTKVVHAEHRLTLHRILPLDTMLERRTRMLSVADRGTGRGMFASFERIIFGPDGEPLATIVHTDACRGDGGCGSAGTPPDPLPRPPERQPDRMLDIPVPHMAGILYRLNGDLNPLHIDPARAAAGGFARPILHGLCTFGYAGYAISQLALPEDKTTITSIGARFSAPFYPGETLRTEIWTEDADVHFRCRSVERDITVLDNGAATLGVFLDA
jgi:acyl dehydratase